MVTLALGARAQSADGARPDESWTTFADEPAPAASTPAAPVSQPLTAPPLVDRPFTLVGPKLVPPEFLNTASVFSASSLGRHRWGFAVSVGFPLLAARVVFGASGRVDLGAQFESLYGSMNDPRLTVKWRLVGTETALALVASVGPNFFAERAIDESNGARWLTGRRNWNAAPGLVASFAPANWNHSRFFLDARCEIAMDTEPFSVGPLTGVPPSVQFSANLPILIGAEVPLSSSTAFTVSGGVDFHGRREDSAASAMLNVGIVAGL